MSECHHLIEKKIYFFDLNSFVHHTFALHCPVEFKDILHVPEFDIATGVGYAS